MKILYYDCFAGISGDMNLGALIDLGVDPDFLKNELKKLNISGYEIIISEQQRKGITGTRAEVKLFEHGHTQHKHHIGPDFIFARPQTPDHEHRNLADIEKIVNVSDLSKNVKSMSLDIFKLIAKAESKIHGISVEKVHFHEVGAIDSIVDIVGAAICIDYLKPDRIISSAVEMGGGFVKCAHGTFPVPAPATMEIMRGKPLKLGSVPFETATPTGVAILVTITDEFNNQPNFTISGTGYGIGKRDTEIPNVLRVCWGEISEMNETHHSTGASILECNIDDMNPEYYEFIMERLFTAGADDVFIQNIIMKKSRPAVQISVLCNNSKVKEMEDILFSETTTIGLRTYQVSKKILSRKIEKINTPWGDVRIKTTYRGNDITRIKPEYEDCAAIARQNNLSIDTVYKLINQKITCKSKI